MATESMDYAALVQEEFLKAGLNPEKRVSFCKVKKKITEENFKEEIQDLATANHISYDQAMDALRAHYDGYHFTASSPGIYNPYSIINALDDKSFNNYWFSSGTPTVLVDLLQKKGLDMLQVDGIWASASRFDVPTEKLSDPIPVLYQSGYLTIKEYNADRKQYLLGFPNEEVRKGFSESLYRYYASDAYGAYDDLVASYDDAILKHDDMESFLPHLKTFYDKFPYTLVNNNERHYQAVLYTIFCMLGADIVPEHQTSNGRIDLLLRTSKSVYIFELKYGKDAGVAINQIHSNRYAASFADEKRKVYLVGINFSKDQRTIDAWSLKTANFQTRC